MPTIGSLRHAREIHAFKTDPPSYDAKPPRDWEKVGSGSFRDVWGHVPSGVVYKLDDNEWSDEKSYTNARELHNARVLRSGNNDGHITPFLRIPPTSGYRVDGCLVLAMEWVHGDNLGWGQSNRAARGRTDLVLHGRFEDMHVHNFVVQTDNTVIPIDMGSKRHRNPASADLRAISGVRLADATRLFEQRRRIHGW